MLAKLLRNLQRMWSWWQKSLGIYIKFLGICNKNLEIYSRILGIDGKNLLKPFKRPYKANSLLPDLWKRRQGGFRRSEFEFADKKNAIPSTRVENLKFQNYKNWVELFFLITRYHEVCQVRGVVEIDPTSLPELFKPTRTFKWMFQSKKTYKITTMTIWT